jgi:hypothetical protein
VLLTSAKGKVRPHESDCGPVTHCAVPGFLLTKKTRFLDALRASHHLILFSRLLQISLEKTKKALLLLLHHCGYTVNRDTAEGGCATQVS